MRSERYELIPFATYQMCNELSIGVSVTVIWQEIFIWEFRREMKNAVSWTLSSIDLEFFQSITMIFLQFFVFVSYFRWNYCYCASWPSWRWGIILSENFPTISICWSDYKRSSSHFVYSQPCQPGENCLPQIWPLVRPFILYFIYSSAKKKFSDIYCQTSCAAVNRSSSYATESVEIPVKFF